MTTIQLSPDAAVLAFTTGLAAIALECNRPGLILPGSAGLLTILLAVASLYRAFLSPVSAAIVAGCLCLLLVRTRLRLPAWLAAIPALGLTWGWRSLLAPPARVDWPTAALCGLLTGIGGWSLTGIALRARQAKALPKAIN